MIYNYHVEFETDPETKEIVVSLPSLNYTADSGETVEEALENLSKLATGFVEVLLEHGENIPPSDKLEKGVYLSFRGCSLLRLEKEELGILRCQAEFVSEDAHFLCLCDQIMQNRNHTSAAGG